MRALWIRFAIATAIIIILSFILESSFRKGGTDSNYPLYLFIITFLTSCIYLWNRNLLMKIEIVTFSFLIAVVSLTASYFSTTYFLEKIYGIDYEIYLNEVWANCMFFMTVNVFLVLASLLLIRHKK